MQTFANGRLPDFDDDMVQELADEIAKLARRGKARGMRINFEWLTDYLDGNVHLARAVLRRAGFRRCPVEYAIGGGNSRPEEFTYPEVFGERLEGILDDYDPT